MIPITPMTLRKLVRTMLNEATAQNDLYYYNLADDFHDKMKELLRKGKYENRKDGTIVFRGDQVASKYSNLLVLFIDRKSTKTAPNFGGGSLKGSYAVGTYKKFKVIVINNLTDELNPYKGINNKKFIHEFIHYLDYNRSGDYKPDFKDDATLEDYYNNPFEFNAYYQEQASYITQLLGSNQAIVDQFKDEYKSFKEFYEWSLDKVFDADFIKHINKSNLRKLQKRVYNIYSEYLE